MRKRSNTDDLSDSVPAKKKRTVKPYVPGLRSGPYAILIALSSLPEASSKGLTKAQTIEIAQPYCDSSFTSPSDPTKFYTAWDSIKTLVSKELVYDFGRPTKKYALTEEGWEVAKRIKRTTVGGTNTRQDKAPSIELPRRTTTRFVDIGEEDSDSEEAHFARATCASRADLHSTHKNARGHSSKLPEDASAYRPLDNPILHLGRETEFLELLSSPASGSTQSSRQWTAPVKEIPSRPIDSIDRRQRLGTNTLPLENNGIQHNDTQFNALCIDPGNFTVELVLDNREVRSKTDRDYIQDQLRTRGVRPIVRPLDLGDAIWVAKCKDPQLLARFGEEGDEIVLDWIVERKRLDDLISSIKDGRFTEQKFRMHKSGIKNVVYIVEEISLSQDTSQKYHEHIMSAIASTQVVNGYFVKRTRKLDDTIHYLARMTTMLKALYESKPIHLIPSTSLSSTTYLPLLASLQTPHYITYHSFASLVSKSDSLNLGDIFVKMLMCTKGITGDKAVEIQKHWTTPSAFAEALSNVDDGDALVREADDARAKRRRELVWKVAGGLVGRRQIGKAYSARVGDIWGEP